MSFPSYKIWIPLLLPLCFLLIQSCMSFQEKLLNAHNELKTYTFKGCSKQKLLEVVAYKKRGGKVILISEDFKTKEGYTFQALIPIFKVEVEPESDAVELFELIEKNWEWNYSNIISDRSVIDTKFAGYAILDFLNERKIVNGTLGSTVKWIDNNGRNCVQIGTYNYEFINRLCR